MRLEILGSLDGPFGPFLAKGPAGPLVLRRATPHALAATGSAHVVDAMDRIDLQGRSFDVEPFVEGVSLADEPVLTVEQRIELWSQVARGLNALHKRGRGHGAVRGGRIRVEPSGIVRLVGGLGGPVDIDDGALESLADYLWDDVPAGVRTALANASGGSLTGAPLRGLGMTEARITAHELVGATTSAAGGAPPKVRVALVAALTLLLGLAAGSLLAGCGGLPAEVTVHVPGAISVQVFCGGDVTHRTGRGVNDTVTFAPEGNHCEVEAPLSPVMPLRGTLEIGAASVYECSREGVRLWCAPKP